MEEITKLLREAQTLAAEKNYPFFCACADMDTGNACIILEAEKKEALLIMLTGISIENPQIQALFKSVFIETIADLVKKKSLINLAKKNGTAN